MSCSWSSLLHPTTVLLACIYSVYPCHGLVGQHFCLSWVCFESWFTLGTLSVVCLGGIVIQISWFTCYSHVSCFCFSKKNMEKKKKKKKEKRKERKKERKKERLWTNWLAWGYVYEIAEFLPWGFCGVRCYLGNGCGSVFCSIVFDYLAPLFPNLFHFSPLTLAPLHPLVSLLDWHLAFCIAWWTTENPTKPMVVVSLIRKTIKRTLVIFSKHIERRVPLFPKVRCC